MIHVRAARGGDAACWLDMRHALWPGENRSALEADVARYLAGAPMPTLQHVLVAEDDAGHALGFAELSLRPYAEGCETDRVAFLEAWYVVPDARRRGVGRMRRSDSPRRPGCDASGRCSRTPMRRPEARMEG